jgi:hypothetical protein
MTLDSTPRGFPSDCDVALSSYGPAEVSCGGALGVELRKSLESAMNSDGGYSINEHRSSRAFVASKEACGIDWRFLLPSGCRL